MCVKSLNHNSFFAKNSSVFGYLSYLGNQSFTGSERFDLYDLIFFHSISDIGSTKRICFLEALQKLKQMKKTVLMHLIQ